VADQFANSRKQFHLVLASQMKACHVTPDETALIVGGSSEDAETLSRVGFAHVVNSNLPTDLNRTSGKGLESGPCGVPIDAEEIDLPDESFDLVFAHAVLHHCRSPHLALCEMLRVCKKHVVFLEPNDSLVMRFLEVTGFSFPYEIGAVVGHDCSSGGVRDSQIPNYIYRWNRREVFKTVSSSMPERVSSIHCHPYWDFNATERDLDDRVGSRTAWITSVVGTRKFLSALRFAQVFLNVVPLVRHQGNKFFCCVEKHPELRPWLVRDDRKIAYNREFAGCP
jgi:SAM-dependent methyltransferase